MIASIIEGNDMSYFWLFIIVIVIMLLPPIILTIVGFILRKKSQKPLKHYSLSLRYMF